MTGNVERLRSAYTTIIEEQQAVLLRAARRLCGGKEDYAQDLVQDALIKGYTAFVEGRFQEGTNVRAWLLRILTNGFITEYNRTRKWDASLDVDTLAADGSTGIAALHAPASGNPEDALLACSLDEAVEKAVASLSHELRTCVILVDIEEMDYAETAHALDIPIGTVRSRLFRARKQLHTQLYEYARQRRRVSN